MADGILRSVTTILTAAMLLIQTVASLPAACVCGSQETAAHASCCQSDVAEKPCCGESCCSDDGNANDCACGESNPISQCGCGCGDDDEHEPYAPTQQSERSRNNVELLVHVPHLTADAATLFPEHQHAAESTLHAHGGSHSVQALLCVWRT